MTHKSVVGYIKIHSTQYQGNSLFDQKMNHLGGCDSAHTTN